MPELLRFTDPGIVFAGDLADGDLLVPATDLDHPEVIDDAVDGLIERALSRGWVARWPTAPSAPTSGSP